MPNSVRASLNGASVLRAQVVQTSQLALLDASVLVDERLAIVGRCRSSIWHHRYSRIGACNGN